MENKRKVIQLITALIYNLNLKGLKTGNLFNGPTKGVCVPGLNCYSCPAAVGSCPLGALQSTLTTFKRGVNLYVIGTILMVSSVFGRFVCGWLCPFGLLQELLYKIPLTKYEGDFRRLKWIKYVILGGFVFFIPIYVAMDKGIGFPAFCKYICPQGTVGGIILLAAQGDLFDLVGVRFIVKCMILLLIILLSVVIFRPFCRLICPLGAIYGLFNAIALVRIDYNPSVCTGCSMCKHVCPMRIDPVRECNGTECIRCGKCITTCNERALSFNVHQKDVRKNELF